MSLGPGCALAYLSTYCLGPFAYPRETISFGLALKCNRSFLLWSLPHSLDVSCHCDSAHLTQNLTPPVVIGPGRAGGQGWACSFSTIPSPEPIHLVKEMVTVVAPATNQGKDVSSGAEKQQIQTKYLQQKNAFKDPSCQSFQLLKEKRIQKNSFS